MSSTGRTFKEVEVGSGEGIEFIRAKGLAEALELEGSESIIAVEGTFIGTQPNTHNAGKMDFRFEKEDGGIALVNGAGNLGFRMNAVSVGDYLQIRYVGKAEITSGQYKGKMSHQYEVLTAE